MTRFIPLATLPSLIFATFIRVSIGSMKDAEWAIKVKREHIDVQLGEKNPRAFCLPNSIGLELRNPLLTHYGRNYRSVRIFASRHQNDPECVRYFSRKDPLLTFDLLLHMMPCGIKSKRLTKPQTGLEYYVDLVLSFGSATTGMTEDDELFQIRCEYIVDPPHSSTVQTVAAALEISTYPKTFLMSSTTQDDEFGAAAGLAKRALPFCKYTIHAQTLDGPAIESAKLGDKVFHKWKCENEELALKVYQCFVEDGSNKGKRYHLIDENGCSKDTNLMPNLVYEENTGVVYIASRVFKFTESPRVFFNCLLYICPRVDSECRRTVPPKCPRAQLEGGQKQSNLADISFELSQWKKKKLRIRRKRSSNETGGEDQQQQPTIELFTASTLTTGVNNKSSDSSNDSGKSFSPPIIDKIVVVDEEVTPAAATSNANGSAAVCSPSADAEQYTAEFGDREKRRLSIALARAHTVVKILVVFNCITLVFTVAITLLSCRSKFRARVKISHPKTTTNKN